MKIYIENFNGIKELTYQIQNSKINFLFGISGCGKSSIANALTTEINNNNVYVGKSINDVVVKVDDNDVDRNAFKVYDLIYMNNIIIEKTNKKDFYSILLGDGGKIEEYRRNYGTTISNLMLIKDEVIKSLVDITKLINNLHIEYSRTNNNEYLSKCLIKKMVNNIDSLPSYSKTNKLTSSMIKWFSDGIKTREFLNGKCPFCRRKLTLQKKERINKLIIFDAKTYEKIASESNTFESLGIDIPDWNKKRQVSNFNNKIKELIKLKSELEIINSYIDFTNRIDFSNQEISIDSPSLLLKKIFPNIYHAVSTFKQKIRDIKKTFYMLKVETNKVIQGNLFIINNKLEMLGIPYKFHEISIDKDKREAEYVIVHNLLLNDSYDMSDNLSFGEKNLIGLLLFLLTNKNGENLIIDDPASSFDEYRRKVIFDFIYELNNNNTVLVLSHDHVFAKYAVFSQFDANNEFKSGKSMSDLKKRYLNLTGNIDYLESYNEIKILPIEFSDFNSLDIYIKEKLDSLNKRIDYQTALNLRMFFESKKTLSENSLIYSYLSAIIHKTDYNLIINFLNKKGKDEEYILNKIFEKTSITYSKLENNYIDKIENFNLCLFEKIIKCRETINMKIKKNKILRDELSNVIHMNDAYLLCLNPYKFNYFSKYVYDYLLKH